MFFIQNVIKSIYNSLRLLAYQVWKGLIPSVISLLPRKCAQSMKDKVIEVVF